MGKSNQNWMADCVEDYVKMKDCINNICIGIDNPEIGMPNMFPVCNDTSITDQLTKIAFYIRDLRRDGR